MKRGCKVMGVAAICAGALVMAGGAAGTGESVRAELVRLEKEKGLPIAFYENDFSVISFKKRASYEMGTLVPMAATSGGEVSPDGSEVAVLSANWGQGYRDHSELLDIVRTDGRGLREYREVRGVRACWSHDKSKLALSVFEVGRPGVRLGILDLASKELRTLDPQTTDEYPYFTAQCWSPDEKELVFEDGGKVRVYNIETRHARTLATGTEPTWSPDGNRIAFRDGENYYAIHPSLETKKKLFHKTRAVSGLYWSPDGRFVAYVHQDFFALDVEFYHLMVRRLADNDEVWVTDSVGAGISPQCIENPELLARALATGKR